MFSILPLHSARGSFAPAIVTQSRVWVTFTQITHSYLTSRIQRERCSRTNSIWSDEY